MNKATDFIAKVYYLTAEQGSRKTPAVTGYFPQVKFSSVNTRVGGQQKFIDKEIVNPGEDVTTEVTLLLTDPFKESLKIGSKFDVMEGARIVRKGIIIEILNLELLAK